MQSRFKKIFLVGVTALTLGVASVAVPSVADARGGHGGGGFHGGGRGGFHGGGRGFRGGRGFGGYRRGYYGGYGYYRGYGYRCGPIALVAGACGPYYGYY